MRSVHPECCQLTRIYFLLLVDCLQGESVAQQAELSARFSTWWDKQDLQTLQSLLQDPLRDDQQANPAALTNMDVCEPLPGQLQTQLLWDVSKLPSAASSDATTATAAAAQLAIDALLAGGVNNAAGMGFPAPAPATAQQAQHASPFAMPAVVNAAGALAEPAAEGLAELHLPAVLAPEDVGLPVTFLSPFAGPCTAQQQPLHAPDLLPGYKLPAPITAGSRGPSPTSSAAFDHAAGIAVLGPSTPHAGADAGRLQDQRVRMQAHAGAAAAAGADAMQAFSTSPEAALLQDWQAGMLPAGQVYPSTPAGSILAENGVSAAATAPDAQQHVSPFQMASPLGLDAACAGQRSPSAADWATAIEAAEAAAAAAALAQGAWPMDVLDTGLPAQGVRQGRVRKGSGGVPGNGRKVHSSTKTRLQIKDLEEQNEVRLSCMVADGVCRLRLRAATDLCWHASLWSSTSEVQFHCQRQIYFALWQLTGAQCAPGAVAPPSHARLISSRCCCDWFHCRLHRRCRPNMRQSWPSTTSCRSDGRRCRMHMMACLCSACSARAHPLPVSSPQLPLLPPWPAHTQPTAQQLSLLRQQCQRVCMTAAGLTHWLLLCRRAGLITLHS